MRVLHHHHLTPIGEGGRLKNDRRELKGNHPIPWKEKKGKEKIHTCIFRLNVFSNHRAKQVKRKYPLPHTTIMSSFIFPSSIFILVRLPPFARGRLGSTKKICSKKYFQFYFEI
jgi:hypothetical protein